MLADRRRGSGERRQSLTVRRVAHRGLLVRDLAIPNHMAIDGRWPDRTRPGRVGRGPTRRLYSPTASRYTSMSSLFRCPPWRWTRSPFWSSQSTPQSGQSNAVSRLMARSTAGASITLTRIPPRVVAGRHSFPGRRPIAVPGHPYRPLRNAPSVRDRGSPSRPAVRMTVRAGGVISHRTRSGVSRIIDF